MNILSTPASRLAGFQKSVMNAVSMFTQALNNLNAVNAQIEAEAEVTETKMNELKAYTESLNTQKTTNNKVIGKIKSIIED